MMPTKKKRGSTLLGVNIGLMAPLLAAKGALRGTWCGGFSGTYCQAFNRCCRKAVSVAIRTLVSDGPMSHSLKGLHTRRSSALGRLFVFIAPVYLFVDGIRPCRLRHGHFHSGSVFAEMKSKAHRNSQEKRKSNREEKDVFKCVLQNEGEVVECLCDVVRG